MGNSGGWENATSLEIWQLSHSIWSVIWLVRIWSKSWAILLPTKSIATRSSSAEYFSDLAWNTVKPFENPFNSFTRRNYSELNQNVKRAPSILSPMQTAIDRNGCSSWWSSQNNFCSTEHMPVLCLHPNFGSMEPKLGNSLKAFVCMNFLQIYFPYDFGT